MKRASLFKTIFGSEDFNYQEISQSNKLFVENSSFLKFVTEIPVLEEMSFLMEEIVIRYAENAEMYVSFQKFSRAAAVWPRYQEISKQVDRLYVFGENDYSLKKYPNIEFVDLAPKHPLVKEWFIVIDLENAKSLLTAYDLDGFGKFENEKKRRFKGIKTNNPIYVEEAISFLKNII